MKRYLCVVLTLVMVLGCIPTSAFATMTTESVQSSEKITGTSTELVIESTEASVETKGEYTESTEPQTNESIPDEITADDSFVVVGEDLKIDAEHFPDAAFRQYVAANIDTNADGILNQVERDRVIKIDVSNARSGERSSKKYDYQAARYH